MLNDLMFDEAAHEYRVEGRKLPSVTGILKAAGFIDTTFMDEAAMQRGTYVHQACEYFDQGDLREETLNPLIQPFLEGWKLFLKEMRATVRKIEWRVYHPGMDYAGTLDRILEIGGRLVLGDIKSGAPAAWHAVQTAAYATAVRYEEPEMVLGRASVYLTKEGTYKYVEHKDRVDFDVWKAAVVVANWKGKNS